MDKQEINEREATWGDILLTTLLFPYLLSANFMREYEEQIESLRRDKEEKPSADPYPKEETKAPCENECPQNPQTEEEPVVKQQKTEEQLSDPDLNNNEDDVPTEVDPIIAEYEDDDALPLRIADNNKHTEYYALADFVRDALVDLESGTEELNWEYNPDDVNVRLNLAKYVNVDDKTATLFNATTASIDLDVSIKKDVKSNEYYLVVEL